MSRMLAAAVPHLREETETGEHMLTLLYDDGLACEVTCSAPEGAWCRMACKHGCDEWYNDHDSEHDHKLEDAGHCLAVDNFDATDAQNEGNHLGPITSGPVEVYWDEGGPWKWRRVSAFKSEAKNLNETPGIQDAVFQGHVRAYRPPAAPSSQGEG